MYAWGWLLYQNIFDIKIIKQVFELSTKMSYEYFARYKKFQEQINVV